MTAPHKDMDKAIAWANGVMADASDKFPWLGAQVDGERRNKLAAYFGERAYLRGWAISVVDGATQDFAGAAQDAMAERDRLLSLIADIGQRVNNAEVLAMIDGALSYRARIMGERG